MTEISVSEFPFVAELPKRAKGKLQTLWDAYSELSKLTEEHGMLIPCSFAAELAGVSRQRIHRLCEQGDLVTVNIGPRQRFITEASFVEWAKSERKAGRPFKAPSLKESMVMAKRLVKQPSEKR